VKWKGGKRKKHNGGTAPRSVKKRKRGNNINAETIAMLQFSEREKEGKKRERRWRVTNLVHSPARGKEKEGSSKNPCRFYLVGLPGAKGTGRGKSG